MNRRSQESQGRIALFCQHFYPEMVSTGMHMTELATGLARRGWDITVYCAKPSWGRVQEGEGPIGQFDYEGVHIARVSSFGSQTRSMASRVLFAATFMAASAWEALRHVRSYTCIVATTNPPFIGLVGAVGRWLAKKPFLLIVYDVYPDIAVRAGALSPQSPIAWLWERVTCTILKAADVIVVIGRDMETVVRQKMNAAEASRIIFVPNWSDETHVQPVPSSQNGFLRECCLEGKFVVQYAGRMGRTHNLEPLVEAARLLKDRPVVFQFVGDGAKKSALQSMVTQYGLENVQFVPYQPMNRLAEMLSAASLSVICLESQYTGMSVPSKTYGAMASGRPILALLDPQSEIGLTVRETECGYVLKDPSGVQVAIQIEELMSRPERLAELGRNARDRFLRDYTLTRAIDRYEAILSKLCSAGAGGTLVDEPVRSGVE